MLVERTWVGLDVHARSVVACAIISTNSCHHASNPPALLTGMVPISAVGTAHSSKTWSDIAEEIRTDILTHGVSDRGVLRQHYDTDALDASTLLAPLFGFLPVMYRRAQAPVVLISCCACNDAGTDGRPTPPPWSAQRWAGRACRNWSASRHMLRGRRGCR